LGEKICDLDGEKIWKWFGGGLSLYHIKRTIKMEYKIEFSVFWDLTDYPNLDVNILEQLKNVAQERMFEMRNEGYTSGQLHYEDDNISLSGWWSVTTIICE
jgi:hypothetical protein